MLGQQKHGRPPESPHPSGKDVELRDQQKEEEAPSSEKITKEITIDISEEHQKIYQELKEYYTSEKLSTKTGHNTDSISRTITKTCLPNRSTDKDL